MNAKKVNGTLSSAKMPAQGKDANRSGGGLEIKNLYKKFGDFTALKDINLRIERGEFLTLLGPSGSGKTTLLMMIAGFEDAHSGMILLDGNAIDNLPAEKRNFGMVFQGYALFPHMSVSQNIIYPLEVRRYSKPLMAARLAEMLKLVQLEEFADRLPRQLSGGQQQRVALARALSFEPQILLLDEPLGALDKKLRMQVQMQLKEIHEKVKTTFIYVTHDQEEALSMSDRIAIMREGQLVQLGMPRELYESPKTIFAAGFLGKSNFLHGLVKHSSASSVTYEIGSKIFTQNSKNNLSAGDKISLALRPEKIEIAPLGKINIKSDNKVSGTVRSLSYFGASLALTVMADTIGEMTVDLDVWRSGHGFKSGQSVDLAWQDDAAVIVNDDA